jgi:hypothetical protein
VRPRLLDAARSVPGGRVAEGIIRRRRFERGLRRLNLTLADTPIDGHYWVWSGLLLGWAREGAVLRHDCRDADFACLDEDWHRLLESVPALVRRGFRPLMRFRNNAGVITQLAFRRQGVDYDFFRFRADGDHFTYFEYWGFHRSDTTPIEMEGELPRQDLEPLRFLSSSWLKVRDHERELEALYGDWRVPRPDWQGYRDCPAIVSRQPWTDPNPEWDGDDSAI